MADDPKDKLVVYHVLDGRALCGATSVTENLVQALNRNSCKASLWFLYEGPGPESARRKGIPVRVSRNRNLLLILAEMISVSRDHAKKGYKTVFHSHQLRANRLASFVASLTPAHHVISVHTHKEVFIKDAFPNPIKRQLVRKWHYWTVKRADGIVAVSPGVFRELKERGVPPDRLRLVDNAMQLPGLDLVNANLRKDLLEELKLPSNSFLIIAAGRFVPLKRFDLLISAVAELKDEFPELRVALAGSGPLEDELKQLAANLEVLEKIIFLGWRNDLAQLLAASDGMISCSNTESSPVTLIEAMALGKPIIAASSEDVVNLIADKKAGFLFPAGDLSRLCDCMRRLVTDKELMKSMGEFARNSVADRFHPDKAANMMIDFYQYIDTKRLKDV
jgi:glycosyltransferase involved in cell wall biosynthesis